jgi:FkbM family methyltransferase
MELRGFFARNMPKNIRKYIPKIIYKHLYFTGEFDFFYENKYLGKLLNTSSEIENGIYWRGLNNDHEPKSMQIWIRLIREFQPKRVLDIGANTGIYGVLAKLVSPNSDIHFFEPSNECNLYIEKSLSLNGHKTGFSIHNIALSDRDESSEMFVARTKTGVPYAYPKELGKDTFGEYRKIGFCRLETLFERLSIRTFEFVKMDIEGMEPKALRGFGNLLNGEAIFLLEVLSEVKAIEIAQLFSKRRYVFYNIDDNKKVVRKQPNVTKSSKWNILIVPRVFESLTDELLVD